MIRDLVVEQAVLMALTPGGLTPRECAALTDEEAKEVARRLIEESRRLLGDRR